MNVLTVSGLAATPRHTPCHTTPRRHITLRRHANITPTLHRTEKTQRIASSNTSPGRRTVVS